MKESWGDFKCEKCGVTSWHDDDIFVFDDDGVCLCTDCYFEQESEKYEELENE